MLEHKHLIVRARLEKPPTDQETVEVWVRKLGEGKITTGLTPEGIFSVLVGESNMVAARFWNPDILQLDVLASEIHPTDVFDLIDEFIIVTKSHLFLDRTSTIQRQEIY